MITFTDRNEGESIFDSRVGKYKYLSFFTCKPFWRRTPKAPPHQFLPVPLAKRIHNCCGSTTPLGPRAPSPSPVPCPLLSRSSPVSSLLACLVLFDRFAKTFRSKCNNYFWNYFLILLYLLLRFLYSKMYNSVFTQHVIMLENICCFFFLFSNCYFKSVTLCNLMLNFFLN